LDHPHIRAAVVEQGLCIVNHAAIDSGHRQRDSDQQAEPHASEDELAPAMQDIAAGKADHCRTVTAICPQQ
jgi:hypothetical protein